MTTFVTRADFAQLKGITPKLLRFFEEQFASVAQTASTVDGQVQSTNALQNATVITLSPNAAFNNERVLKQGSGISIIDGGDTLTISASNGIAVNGGYRLTFNVIADTTLDLPASGALITADLDGASYANDAAAAAGGVMVGEIYKKTGGTVAWRQV